MVGMGPERSKEVARTVPDTVVGERDGRVSRYLRGVAATAAPSSGLVVSCGVRAPRESGGAPRVLKMEMKRAGAVNLIKQGIAPAPLRTM